MTRNIYSTSGRGAVEFNPSPPESLSRQSATEPLFYDCVWINGELVPTEDASVRDEPGIFEEIRCYPTDRGPAIFRLEAHLQRFLQAAHAMGVGELRYNLLDLRRAVHVTVYVNNQDACTVRPIVYVERRAGGDFFPTVAIVTASWEAAGAQQSMSDGLRLMTSTLDREGPAAALTREALQDRTARSTQARVAARGEGFDEAILVGRDDRVIDCTGDNLFLVRDGSIVTPLAVDTDDVARDTVITLLRDLGYAVTEQPIRQDQLFQADEIFVCGITSEIAPVIQIDAYRLAPSPGPVTRAVQKLYADTARGVGRRSRGWLDYVMMEPLF